MVAPEVFKLREENGHSYVESELVSPEFETNVRKAEAGCPERAISITD
jgi:ferredoxin